MDLGELYALLPVPAPLRPDGVALGILISLTYKYRNELYDTVISLKDGTYGWYDLLVLLGLPLLAVGMLASKLLTLDLSIPAAVVASLYLVIDGFVTAATGKKGKQSPEKSLLIPLLHGFFLPNGSPFALAFPLFLAIDVPWEKALYATSVYTMVYVSGGILSRIVNPFYVVLGATYGLLVLSLYKTADNVIPYNYLRPLYGLFALLLTLLVL